MKKLCVLFLLVLALTSCDSRLHRNSDCRVYYSNGIDLNGIGVNEFNYSYDIGQNICLRTWHPIDTLSRGFSVSSDENINIDFHSESKYMLKLIITLQGDTICNNSAFNEIEFKIIVP